MRARLVHAASCMSFCSLVACNGSTAELGDTDDGTTHAESDTTSTDTDTQPMTDATSPSDSSSDATADTSGGTDDTTGGEVVAEPWCGYAGTGPRVLEGPGSSDLLPLTVHLGGPIALPLWYYDDGGGRGLRAAVYDIATATWGDTVTLDVSGEVEIGVDPNGLGGDPTGAVDAEGNAIVVSSDNLGEPSVRVHRYDAAAASWTTSTLSSAFTTVRTKGITVDADGDAILIAQNELEFGISAVVQWFYDAATDSWSAPDESGPIESYGVSVAWAQDRESGDAAFFMETATDVIQLRHRSAATGEWIMQDFDTSGEFYPHAVVSIGDGRFVAIAVSGDFGVDNGRVVGVVFEDGEWQPEFVLDDGVDVSSMSVSGDDDGRMFLTWNAHPTRIRARSYDASAGWSPLHVVNAGQEGMDYIVDVRGELDDDGFVVGWSQLHNASYRTYVRRHDDDDEWGPTVEVDPQQPALSDISALHAIAADDTRIVWARDEGNANYTGWYYACHAPGNQWSDPVAIDLEYPRFQTHAGGEFLVVGRQDGIVAEYFAAR
jgi:hypothetical protein